MVFRRYFGFDSLVCVAGSGGDIGRVGGSDYCVFVGTWNSLVGKLRVRKYVIVLSSALGWYVGHDQRNNLFRRGRFFA